MPKFFDIKEFPYGNYKINVSLKGLQRFIKLQVEESKLNMNPDFQRGHVWNEKQQISFVEYLLQNGRSGRDILTNCPGWSKGNISNDYVVVDGKQRLNALLRFTNNEIPAFGYLYREYEDKPRMEIGIVWNVAELRTKAEVLKWYLAFNSGGTAHTEEELNKVRLLLQKEMSGEGNGK